MKKILFVALAVVTLASCKKDNDGGSSNTVHMKAKVNGTMKEFNFVNSAQSFDAGKSIVVMAAGGTTNSPYPYIMLTVSDENAAITAKTYSSDPDDEAGAIYNSSASFSDSYGSTEFTITVTSISATEIKGTFSGKVSNGSTTLDVTEGSFYSKFQ